MSEVDLEIARIAGRQHAVLSIERLRVLGLSDPQIRRRVADGRLHPHHRGVYSVGHRLLTQRGRWMAAVLALGRGALLSHSDAAALWDLTKAGAGAIHVTVEGRARRRRRGLIVHATRTVHPEDRAVVDRIPVTSLPRTLLDLAELTAPTQLQRAYEAAARRELLDVRAIERLLERSNGRRGVPRLRALLAYDPAAAAAANSELERLFLDLVRGAGLPTPQVNVLVEGFEVDAYWPEAGLVVELQSYEHHSDRETFERDHVKGAQVKLAGYEFLALTHRQVTELASATVETLKRLLDL